MHTTEKRTILYVCVQICVDKPTLDDIDDLAHDLVETISASYREINAAGTAVRPSSTRNHTEDGVDCPGVSSEEGIILPLSPPTPYL
ncbi:hypothetical protein RRG08_046239 [Elysia crispata]|uniref:Uncharacterized protein n=1 Tax=Elysia crispata TaxID=231223 RepID=A0AAE1D1E0_9GAST|nr:hypothetical protein RRG08_046239 [Elysia crispata]